MRKLFITILSVITNMFKTITYYLDTYMNSVNEKDVKITVIQLSDNNRYLSFEMTNNKLLDSK
jgi:hypothetical protein